MEEVVAVAAAVVESEVEGVEGGLVAAAEAMVGFVVEVGETVAGA
jgi:hypothetical protein